MNLDWTPLDTWIVVAGALSAASCAVLGCFLVLRRMSLMGDAISHAVLPGLAAAFWLTGSRSSLPMFLGAAAVGVLTAVLTHAIARHGSVEESASMGVVFTSLFALGLVLMVRAADSVDLDPGCVLYGAIELTPLDRVQVAGWSVPRVVIVLGGVLLLNLLFLAAFYKELKLSSFDPELSTTLGFNATYLHYALMALVAMTAVACFESVGSILVIAMLVVPAATALLLADRLWPVLVLSVAVALLAAVLGHGLAITVPRLWGFEDTSTSGMMAVTAGLLFLLAMVFSPTHGLLRRWSHQAALSLRIVEDDLLGLLYRLEELASVRPATHDLLTETLRVGFWMQRLAVWRLSARQEVVVTGDRIDLTEKGRSLARSLIRSHRLWEAYLHQYLGLRADHVHATAERLEHVTDPAMRRELAVVTAPAVLDPQGKRIPEEP